MPELIALCIFVAVAASAYALLSTPRGVVQRRLEAYRDMVALEEDPPEPEPGLMERVGRPMIAAARRLLNQALPGGITERLAWKLTLAGNPLSLTTLLVVWGAAIVLLPAGFIALITLGGGRFGSMQMIVTLALAGGGFLLPNMWLKSKAKQRQKAILKSLPDAIDLLTTSVEAGLGIDAALGQVAEKVRGPISVEIRRVLRDIAMGSSRRDALIQFAERTQLPDVQQFVNAIVQAEQMGVSLGQVIRVQADQMRVKRRQRAEQQAYKAPVKMVFPLVLFIFPAIFVVVLGPAMLQIMKSL
jgi:tight adherence protein C